MIHRKENGVELEREEQEPELNCNLGRKSGLRGTEGGDCAVGKQESTHGRSQVGGDRYPVEWREASLKPVGRPYLGH